MPPFDACRSLGFPTCQVSVGATDDATARQIARRAGSLQSGSDVGRLQRPRQGVYDFYHGPETIGLVPRETRAARIAHLKDVADFAQQARIPAVQGHCGFIPENPNDPLYKEVVEAIREVALYCKSKGLNFRCETGQETPITLVRAIRT